MEKVSMSYLFSFSRYQTKCVLSFSKIYLRTTSKPMAEMEKKMGRQKYKNLNILRMKKSFRWNKTFFIVFEGVSIGEKMKIW